MHKERLPMQKQMDTLQKSLIDKHMQNNPIIFAHRTTVKGKNIYQDKDHST